MSIVSKFKEGFLTPEQCLGGKDEGGYLADTWGKTDTYGCFFVSQWMHDKYMDYPISIDLYFNGKDFIVQQVESGGGKSAWFSSRVAAEQEYLNWLKPYQNKSLLCFCPSLSTNPTHGE